MVKVFLSFNEAAAALGTDSAGLKQALEIDLSVKLPAYVYCGDFPHLARLQGYEPKALGEMEDAYLGSYRPALHSKYGPPIRDTFLSNPVDGSIDAFELGDAEAEIDWSDAPQSITGYPVAFEIRGFFRVHEDDVKEGARQSSLGTAAVAPACWWAEKSVMPRNERGAPRYFFRLCPTNLAKYRDIPTVFELYFRAADIDAFKAGGRAGSHAVVEPPRVKPLRSDRERNLLRVISYLWAESEVDVRPNTAGKAAEDELVTKWGLDGPGRDTVAGILQEAAAIAKGKHPKFK